MKIYGNTPARIIRERFRCRIVPAIPETSPPRPQLEAVPTYKTETGMVEVEGETVYGPGYIYGISTALESGPLTAKKFVELEDGKSLLCAYGCVEYKDAFGRNGRTQFCLIYKFTFGGVLRSPDGTVLNPPGFRQGGPRGYNEVT